MEVADVFIACKKEAHYSRELILPQPVLLRVLSGEVRIVGAARSFHLVAGDTVLLPRNQLGRMSKLPLNGQPCIGISLLFRKERLQHYYAHYPLNMGTLPDNQPKIIQAHPLLKSLVDFMERNYMFNLPLEKFGYLTGRSLTTFKKDFSKAFNTTPGRWLTQKRLEAAHYQIVKKNRKPSEVYLEVGFEDLSHFSFAFKKYFGYNPTRFAPAR